MKTKLSKKILSIVLAALMVVTSVPLMAFSVFADVSTSDLNVSALDSYAKNLYDEMTAFEDKLQEDVVYADVTTAYAKYVAAQKAFDAYVYGTGTTASVENAAAELRDAADAMPVYTGKATANVIPTFANSSEDDMREYNGTGFSNVLYYPQATELGNNEVANVRFGVVYSSSPVLLYDGQTDVKMPVMMNAALTANKKVRYVYSGYPVSGENGQVDNEYFQLTGYWKSGAKLDGTTNRNSVPTNASTVYGDQPNWNWNWWSNAYTPGYNAATGFNGTSANTTDHRSTQLGYKVKWTAGDWYAFDSAYYNYSSNVLQLVKAPTEAYSQEFSNINWYFASGDSPNSDSVIVTTGSDNRIRVINYTTLADAVRTNYNFVKGVELRNYSEGGLTNYFAALKAAATYDPNTAFNNGAVDGFADCVTQMKKLVQDAEYAVEDIQNDEEWELGLANQTEYETLRGTMNKLMTTYNNGVNNGYTDESWDGFIALWTEAQKIMTDVAVNGYENPGRANSAAKLLSEYKLVTNVDKVDTTTIELIMDTYDTWSKIFTDETATALDELITEIKTTVWAASEGGEDQYKNAAAALDDVDHNQELVDSYAVQLVSAIKALRIDPDATVVTSFGRYSLNSAMAREAEVADHKDDYGNYPAFQTALNDAAAYKATLDALSISFEVSKDRTGKLVVTTDFNDQLSNYVAVTSNVVEKREALAAALIKIANGEIMKTVGTETISLENHRNSNGYNHYVNFTYPRSVILFKTTHEDAKFTFGKADLEWRINIDNNIGKDMNALDSITINASRVGGQINEKTWALGQNAYPTGLSDSNKAETAGQLSYTVTNADGTNSTFELENFKVSNQYNNSKSMIAIDDNGNSITDPNADLTSILATTNGSGSRQQYGVIPIQPTNKGDASITLTADFTVTVAGKTAETLSATTRPEVNYYNLSGNYFGATYQWHTQPSGFQYAGWDHLSTVPNGDYVGQEMYSSVMVIDISYLIDLINECNKLTPYSDNFTAESWATFTAALSEANEELAYTDNTSAEALRKTVQNRYDALWNAYNALEIPLTFVGKNADGTDKITTVNVVRNYYLNDALNASEYGVTTDYDKQLTAATTTAETYYSDDLSKRYDLAGWSPEADVDAKITTKATFTADYDESPNLADFTKFNEAKDALIAALSTAEPVYSADTLNAVKADVEAMTYFAMTALEQGEVIATEQGAIDAETAALVALTAGLVPAEVSAADADLYVAAKKSVLDMDVYDVNAVNVEYTAAVTIAGVDYDGLVYDTYDKLNKVVADILNSATKNVYEIKVNGTTVGTAEYGEIVVVDSEGTLHKGIDIDTSFPELTNVAWTYSYEAPSRASQGFTAPKYMLTATSLGFVVKGNTNLTTANAKADEAGYTVKFQTNDGRVFDVQYTTTGTVTMPVAPNYAFYVFTGYDNGKVARQEITVTEDTVITANYEPTTADTFTINYYDGIAYGTGVEYPYWDQAPATSNTYAYNELITLSNPNAVVWAKGTWFADRDAYGGGDYQIVAYGTEYSFYACEDVDIIALTDYDLYDILLSYDDGVDRLLDNEGNYLTATFNEYTGAVESYPDLPVMVYAVDDTFEVYNSLGAAEKFSLIGSVAAPEDCRIVETGFLVSKNQAATLTIENVGVNGVNRLKTSKIIGDNQFVVNINATSNISFKYKAYAIVEMPDGSLNTVYTDVINGSTNF